MDGMGHPLLAETTAILSRLVAFNTEPIFSNRDLVRWVADYLASHGINCKIKTTHTPPPHATPADDNAANGIAKDTLHTVIGPAVDGGVVLSGHTDVVNATAQVWQSSPFGLVEKGGRLYARGSCDMKGFIACVLAQVPRFAAADLKRPLHIALSRDEEIGSVGMPDMLALIGESGLTPAAAVVGEPTEMAVVAGHKAGYEVRTRFSGVAAHSAIPQAGCSATVPAAQFAVFLDTLTREFAAAPVAGTLFDPPHGIINVGRLQGGVAFNIVAEACEVFWHYRPLPEDDHRAVYQRIVDYAEREFLPAMQASGHAGVGIRHDVAAYYDGLPVDAQSPAVRLASELLDVNSFSVAPYGADAGAFYHAGIPAVLVGPGSIAQAHKPDEFIAISELEKCLAFLDRLTARQCQPNGVA